MLLFIPVVGPSLAIFAANLILPIPVTILALDMLGIIPPLNPAILAAITIPPVALTFALAF